MRTNAKVYLMQAKDGTLKLGHSRCPEKRAREIWCQPELVFQTDVLKCAERIERLAHRVLVLHGKHLKGEWFAATIEDGINAIEIAVRQAENEELPLGGSLTAGRKLITIKLPLDLIEEADKFVDSLNLPSTRTAFIEVAMREKLERERARKRSEKVAA